MADFKRLGARLNTGNPAAGEQGPKASLGYWKAVGADSAVLSWLYYGLPQPFASKPPRFTWPNSASAFQAAEFVEQTIAKQVAAGNFFAVDPSFAEVIHPLLVDTNGKKPRLCVNMIPTNAYLAAMPFTNETLGKVGEDIFRQDDHLLTADLAQAYYR